MALKITVQEQESSIKLTLEGRLTGPWVAELDKAWRETAPRLGSKKLLLNLRDLTFSDDEGKQVLRGIVMQSSAEISSSTPLTKHLAQEICTPKTN
jgi:anti-anti-sigma regulatory factor